MVCTTYEQGLPASLRGKGRKIDGKGEALPPLTRFRSVDRRDAFGNPTSTDAGTDTLFANSCLQRTGPGWPCYWVSSVQGSIVPGQYTISYMLTWVAQYSVTLYVKSVAVPNVPGYVTVSPGDAVVATVSGAGASTGTVGESRSFFVVVLDGCALPAL